jgi:hypothetical protein
MKLKDGRKYVITIQSEGYRDLISEIDLTSQEEGIAEKIYEIRSIRR